MKPTTPHDSLDDLIAAALHGDLTPEERAQFESRLSTDPNAQAAYQEAKAMHELLEKTNRSAQPDPDFEQRMVSGVRRKLANPPKEETAWESVLVLCNGMRSFGRALRRVRVPVPRTIEVLAVLFIILILCGVALGPITNGIRKAKQSSEIQMAHALAVQDYERQADSGVANPVMKDASQFLASEDEMKRELEEGQAGFEAKQKVLIPMASPPPLEQNIAAAKVPVSSAPITLNGANTYSGGVSISGGATTVTTTVGSGGGSNGYAEPDSTTTPQGGTVTGKLAQLDDLKTDASAEEPATASAPPMIMTAAQAQPKPLFAPTAAPVASSDATTASPAPAGTMVASAQHAASPQNANLPESRLAFEEADKVKAITAIPKPATPAPATAPAPVDTRKLIRNAQLDLEVKSYQTAFDEVTTLTRAAGGYIDTSNSQRGGNGKLQGTVVVKILPENLDAFLLKLHDLGDVQNQSVSTEDVTKEYFDSQARLVNSQKMEVQLQDLLKRENGKVSDLLAVERELGRVRGEIEQMQGQIKLYDFQVEYATVTMNIAEKDLNQTAAYLLKEQDDFALFATDVEGAFQKARAAADDFKTQVLVANLQHNSGADVSAELTVMVAPDQVEHFLTTIRGLGRVANFTRQTQRIARDGGDSSQPADETRTDKDKVQVHLVIKSDDDTRKQVALVIVAKQVDDALDQAKAAALASTGLEILNSSLNTTPQGASKAQLTVRVPGKEYATLMDAFRALGRQASLSVQRNDNSGPGANGEDVPVIISLSLTDEETPVQATDLVIVTPNVDGQSQQIKKDAPSAGVEVKASSFEGQPNGSHVARLTLLLPMGQYAGYLETLKKLGRVQSLSVQRSDSTGTATDDAPVEISLALTDDDPPVQETNLVISADDVDAQAQQIKKQAGDAGVEIKSSSFQRQPDGSEQAQMTLRLPLDNYPAFLVALQKAGKTESLSVQREDRPDQARPDDTAPAEIQLQLHSRFVIVAPDTGVFATLRNTFSAGLTTLLSCITVIGVVIAFLIPWAAALVFLAWIGRRIYVWRRKR
ncbi:MAG TPA: DUF4349 domain-containing protein [Candidatus Methylacidiphilales bacterium]|jgi:autotransporter-associated beta strand protein|nr:DUF4349 domain-containing protein [Candidatus Methylacidiphilales bacterium]